MAKTPTGVKLDELVSSLRTQNLQIPENIQNLLTEQQKAKVEKQQAKKLKHPGSMEEQIKQAMEKTEKAKEDETEKPKNETVKKTKSNRFGAGTRTFAYHFLKNLVGRDIAGKLIKKTDQEITSDTKPKSSSTQTDLKHIKLLVEEIHDHLLGKGKGILRTKGPSRYKTFTGSFKRNFLGHFGVATKTKPNVEKAYKEVTPKSAEKLPVANINEDTLAAADQSHAAKTKLEVSQAASQKAIQDKLEKIKEDVEKIKKKSSLSIGAIGLLLAAALKKLWSKLDSLLLKPLWKLLKGMSLTLAGLATKIISKIWQLMKNAAKGVIGGAKNLIKKGAGAVENFLVDHPIIGMGARALGAAGATAATFLGVQKAADYELNQSLQQGWPMLKKEYGLEPIVSKPGHFLLKGKEVTRDNLPDQYKTLIDAYTGDTRGGTAKKAQMEVKQHQSDYDALKITPKVENKPQPQVQKPIAQVQKPMPAPKQAPDRLAVASSTNADLKDKQKSSPEVIVIKGGNKITQAPKQQDQTATVTVIAPRNPESSFSRLSSITYDDPGSYTSLTK